MAADYWVHVIVKSLPITILLINWMRGVAILLPVD